MKWCVVLYVLFVSMATIIVASEPNHMLWNSTKEDEAKSRDKRFVVFPYNSEVAVKYSFNFPFAINYYYFLLSNLRFSCSPKTKKYSLFRFNLILDSRGSCHSSRFEASKYVFCLQYGGKFLFTIFWYNPRHCTTSILNGTEKWQHPSGPAWELFNFSNYFGTLFQIDEPNLNAGSVIFNAQSDQRKLDDNNAETVDEENSNATTIQPDLRAETNLNETVTEFTVEVEHPPSVSFKKTNSTQSNSANGRKKGINTKDKKTKKHRVNREILSTLLSRKKFYKILKHKMDM